MKTNRDLAMEIAAKLGGFQEAFDGAMAMAKIKDKQIKRILSALTEQSNDPHVMYDENDLWYKIPLDGSVPFS